ncbi:MAG: hypothetical protein V7K25_24340 [Nostoc sp.]|uniref:hypothetical protein n=1 Tax=Nostoc sp. TaxID=1180 RepID=UPI002FFC4B12
MEKKSNFCIHPILKGEEVEGQGAGSRGERGNFYFLFSPLRPSPCCFASSPLPALIRKDAHLVWHVNDNEKIMQLDERSIIQPTINLRFLVSKNTKY